MPVALSNSHGTPGTALVIWRSIAPNAAARAVGSVSASALSIAASTAGSLNCGQLEVLAGMMVAPLNVRSSIEAASGKSLPQLTVGQMTTFWAGTSQTFVCIESCVTCTSLIL